MRQAAWHIMPGIGAERLDDISADVVRYNRWPDDVVGSMEGLADGLQHRVSQMTELVTNAAIVDGTLGNLDALEAAFNESQQEILRAHAAEAALDAIRRERRGREFGHYMKRASLLVMHEGVTHRRALFQPIHEADARGLRKPVKTGRVIEGTIDNLSSSPEFGGRLALTHAFGQSIIYGLIDPTTGESRVKLDILGKS